MSSEPPKLPGNPWQLTPQRIVLLILGVLLVAIILSTLMGGLNNYQTLRDGAKEQKAPATAPAETTPAEAPPPVN